MENKMRLKKLILFIVLNCFLILPSSVFATTVNGVTVNKKTGLSQGYDVEFLTDFSLSTKWGTITSHVGEFVANEAGSSTVNDGWISIPGIAGLKTISIIVGTATGIGTGTIKIQAKSGTSTNAAAWDVTSFTFTGTTTTGFPVTEYLSAIRMLYNITTIGTDSVSVYGDFLGQTENL